MEEVPVFGLFELGWQEEADGGNPFLEPPPLMTVRHDEGESWEIAGFCDNTEGTQFAARFMPQRAGRYSAEVRLGDRVVRESFVVVDRGLPGIPRAKGWHFEWSGSGEPFYPNSTTAYMLFGLEESVAKDALDRLADQGINRIRVALSPSRQDDGSRWMEPQVAERDDFTYKYSPWVLGDAGNARQPQTDVTRFEVGFWHKVDRIVAYAQSRGIVSEIIFFLDGADEGNYPFEKFRLSASDLDEDRYYAYAVARLGAFSHIEWCVTNEWTLFQTDEWVERQGALIADMDPYGHPLSVHGHGHFPFRVSSWCTHALFQVWDEHGGHEWALRERAEMLKAGPVKPIFNEEFGYEGHYSSPWGEARVAPARSAETRLRIAWGIAMAGCFSTDGETAKPGLGGWINGLNEGESELLRGRKRMTEFFSSFDLASCEPDDDSASGDAWVLRGQNEIAVYLPHGGQTSVDVPEGTWDVQQYEPRSGEWSALLQGQELYRQPEWRGWVSPFVEFGAPVAFVIVRSDSDRASQ